MKYFAFAAVVLFAPATPASAQWSWLNPRPQANALYDVTFLTDEIAIAVGSAGTVMVTHDSGFTWTPSFSTNSSTRTMLQVARLDNATAVIVGDYDGPILKTTDGGLTWVSVTKAIDTFSTLSFAGSVGVAAGNSTEIRSIDGGNTWNKIAGAPLPMHGVDMVTPLIGYCRADFTIFKTVDGGLTWIPIPTAPQVPGYFQAPVSFADEMTGAVASGGATIFVTHDGGITWVERLLGTGESDSNWSAKDMEFVSPGTIVTSVDWVACSVSGGRCSHFGQFYGSTNDGVNWGHESAARVLNGVAINSAGTVLAVGDAGGIYRRDPSGTWQQTGGITFVSEHPLDDPSKVVFRNASVGMVLGSTTDDPQDPYDPSTNRIVVMRTETGGEAWDFSYPEPLIKDIAYPPSSTDAYAIATQASGAAISTVLLRSTDNGATWATVSTIASDLALMAIAFSSPTHGLAIGPAGKAARLDFSGHFYMTQITVPVGMRAIAFADAATAIAVGGTGTSSSSPGFVWRSTNGGSTWLPVNYGGYFLNDVDFASPSVCVAVGNSPYIWRSVNGGVSGEFMVAPIHKDLTAVSLEPGGYGLIVGEAEPWVSVGGTVLETEDGGASWTALTPPTSTNLDDVFTLAPHHALVTGPELATIEYRHNMVPTLIRAMDAVAVPFGTKLKWDVVPDNNLASFSITRSSGSLRETVASDLVVSARSFSDDGLSPGKTYEYQLVAVDRDGSYTQSMPVKVTVPKAPVELLPNQPNPFNPVTTILFVVPEKTRVTIYIHDVAGRLVTTLSDGVQEPGVHELIWNATGVPSGVYFARMHAGKADVSRKMVLLK